jgi:hypothetical protein
MILSVIFSSPDADCKSIFGRDYKKIRILKNPDPAAKKEKEFQAEFFTEKQAFHKNFSESQVENFIAEHAGRTFKNCTERTDAEEIYFRKTNDGKIKISRKKIQHDSAENCVQKIKPFNRQKNYILREGEKIPFLIELGVMTRDGKIVSQKHDKFRQINRFLEIVDDILCDVEKLNGKKFSGENPMRVIDFGSGKSYLTFALQYFLCDVKKIPSEIIGLDLKDDVIKNCAELAEKIGCKNLHFQTGDIANFCAEKNPDLIVTLHACDTATDFALNYAVKKNAKAILSVPCCQHELNSQLEKFGEKNLLASILRHGILRERFCALATDAIRAELLEQSGYRVQVLEFIDMDSTPKNILIRAVKKFSADEEKISRSKIRTENLLSVLNATQKLSELFRT